MSVAVREQTPAAAGAGGSVATAAGPLLCLIFALRRMRLDSAPELAPKVRRQVEDFVEAARRQGVLPADIDDAVYALAAAIDETMLTAEWSGRDAWERESLARRYCNNEFVGDGFFDKLAQIRHGSARRKDVLQVYYYCLAAGFRGRLIEEPAKLSQLMEELSRDLAPADVALAPHGLPQGGRFEPIQRFPWIAVAATCIVIPLFFWALFSFLLDGKADEIVRRLGSITF